MSKINFIALQAASHAFATDPIPDDWDTLSIDDQDEWLEDHQSKPFENDSLERFFSVITEHADTVKDTIKSVLVELKQQLIHAAIEGDLPSDFNELDLETLFEKVYIK